MLNWIESAYTPYDIESSPAMRNRTVVSAALVADELHLWLFGYRRGEELILIDTAILTGDRDIAHLPQVGELSSLNALRGDSVRDARWFNISDEGGQSLRLALSDDRDLHPSETWQLLDLSEGRDMPLAYTEWLGNIDDRGTQLGLRIVSQASISACGGTMPGVATLRYANRRFEGPIADGAPWSDRRALAYSLEELSESGTVWWSGFDKTSAEQLSRLAGRELSPEECERIVIQTYGSLDSAALSTCRLPEIEHVPVVVVQVADRTVCWGIVWIWWPDEHRGSIHRSCLYWTDLPGAPSTVVLQIARFSDDGRTTSNGFVGTLAPSDLP